MAQPALSSSNPANNATDVFLNVPIYATFATPGLSPGSVTVNSVVLVNTGTGDPIPISLSYDADTFIVTITPTGNLSEDTVYSLKFPGLDVAISDDYVIKEVGSLTSLITSIVRTFRTGTRVFIDDTIVKKDVSNLSLEGSLSLPSNVKALGLFAILSSLPKNRSADVDVDINGSNEVKIKFTKLLDEDAFLESMVEVDTYPVLDHEMFLAEGVVFGSGTIPSLTSIEAVDDEVIITYSANLPKNCGVQIRLTEDLTAIDGAKLGPNEYVLSFTTERFPKISGIHVMKTELAAAAKELFDDYIAAVLLKNSVRVLYRWPDLDRENPQMKAYRWVINASIVDILDDKNLEKALASGTRRTLGDMTIAVERLLGEIALKHKRAEEELDKIFFSANGYRIEQALLPSYTPVPRNWFGVSNRLVDTRFRYWQPNLPASNLDITRQAKVGNPWII